ncbi:beta-1,6-N-acetylglucosaminyltransferase [Zunongwangia sp. F363]|uniref:Peptide O-xylosyltransferase n=1 Tax=Autumnicola tepida TaxID=3075595 RepID=A0ABU3C9Q6_9FLAO|nr:beta-1,6-N-acetylglucosaminyltransferase [Zunongwangia sp. F363]MDT0643049.1 beta-1,6-N-acetylglucosaminyltransferase [Zunongwangia sp. F363]
MEINYLILAHKNPLQVKRLITNLEDENTRFYIHVDLQTNIEEFKKSFANPHIHFLKRRFTGIWGDIGIVEATLHGMKKISRTNKKGYCILLSGQDYPLVSKKKIKKFLQEKFPTEYITTYPMPHSGWERGGMDRLTYYKINKSNKRKHFLQLSSIFDKEFYTPDTLGKINYLRKSGRFRELSQILKKRKFPSYIKPFGGSQWWGLTIGTIKKILDYVEQHPDYLKYHKYTLLPDEIFFQSILMELQHKKSMKNLIDRSLTYVNWDRPSGPLPVTFEIHDFPELKIASKDYLFARKFDMMANEKILDKIDSELI